MFGRQAGQGGDGRLELAVVLILVGGQQVVPGGGRRVGRPGGVQLALDQPGEFGLPLLRPVLGVAGQPEFRHLFVQRGPHPQYQPLADAGVRRPLPAVRRRHQQRTFALKDVDGRLQVPGQFQQVLVEQVLVFLRLGHRLLDGRVQLDPLQEDFVQRVPQPLPRLQAEQVLYLIAFDAEHPVLGRQPEVAGAAGGGRVQQPLDGRQRVPLLPVVGGVELLPPVHQPQGDAGHRVQRLHPPAVHHRQPGDGGQVEVAHPHRPRHRRPDQIPEGRHHDERRQQCIDPGPRRQGEDLRRAGGRRFEQQFPQVRHQGDAEVQEHPDRDQHARDVRDQPAGVADHLEGGLLTGRRLTVAALVERLAAIAERAVHRHCGVQVHAAVRVHQVQVAGVGLGQVGAEVLLVGELGQRQGVRLRVAGVPEVEGVGFAVGRHGLGRPPAGGQDRVGEGRHQEGAELLVGPLAEQPDVGGRDVHAFGRVHPTNRGGGHSHILRADPGSGRVVGVARPGRPGLAVQVVGQHLDIDRQFGPPDALLVGSRPPQKRRRDGHDAISGRARAVHEGQLVGAAVERHRRRPALQNLNLLLVLPLPSDPLADEQQQQPAVQQEDARPLPGEPEPQGVGGQQVGEHQPAEQLAARPGEFGPALGVQVGRQAEEDAAELDQVVEVHEHHPGPEVLVHHLPDVALLLGQGAEEH